MTPFTGKLIWGLLIGAGLFFAGAIIAAYWREWGFALLLLFIAAGQILARLKIKKLNENKAKREATS